MIFHIKETEKNWVSGQTCWATGAKPTPDEFDNELMDKLKEHAKNKDKESRIVMPPLKS